MEYFRTKHRVGVFGGTFDPIHNGHLLVAAEVHKQLGLEKIFFVPTGISWQKACRKVTEKKHRYAMTVIAASCNPNFFVSRIDIDRVGKSYTVDTIKALHANNSDLEIYLILGLDAFAGIRTWKNYEQLWDLSRIVVVNRPGYEISNLNFFEVETVEISALNISSTECRQFIKQGISVAHLVPKGVYDYANKYGLYRELL